MWQEKMLTDHGICQKPVSNDRLETLCTGWNIVDLLLTNWWTTFFSMFMSYSMSHKLVPLVVNNPLMFYIQKNNTCISRELMYYFCGRQYKW